MKRRKILNISLFCCSREIEIKIVQLEILDDEMFMKIFVVFKFLSSFVPTYLRWKIFSRNFDVRSCYKDKSRHI